MPLVAWMSWCRFHNFKILLIEHTGRGRKSDKDDSDEEDDEDELGEEV